MYENVPGVCLKFAVVDSAVRRSHFKGKKGLSTTITMSPNWPKNGLESLFLLIDVIWTAVL